MGSRTNKRGSFTVIGNAVFHDRNLSLKAKGLFCLMQSLPAEWDYSLRGLSHICVEGVDSIREGIWELERAGYLKRERKRTENGKYTSMNYVFFDQPQAPKMAEATAKEDATMEDNDMEVPSEEAQCEDEPGDDDSASRFPASVNAQQYNTNRSNKNPKKKKEKNTYPSNTEESNPYQSIKEVEQQYRGWPVSQIREILKQHISYDVMCQQYDQVWLDEIISLIVEVLSIRSPFIKISGAEYPAEVVFERLFSLNSLHIQYVFNCLQKQTRPVNNIKTYLLTILFNAPATITNYYDACVRHDHPYLTINAKEL